MSKKLSVIITALLLSLVFSVSPALIFAGVYAQDEDNEQSPFDPSKARNEDRRPGLDMAKKCKDEGLDTEECKRIRNYTFNTVKDDVSQALLGRLENKLDRLLDRAVEKGDLTEEEAGSLLEEYRLIVEDIKIDLENAESAEDLRAIVSKLRTDARYRGLLGKLASLRMNNRYSAVDNALSRLDNFIERVEQHIAAAKDAGNDTSEAEGLVEDAKSKIGEAKSLVTERDTTDFEGSKETFIQVKDLLKVAHADLKASVKKLRVLYDGNPWSVE